MAVETAVVTRTAKSNTQTNDIDMMLLVDFHSITGLIFSQAARIALSV